MAILTGRNRFDTFGRRALAVLGAVFGLMTGLVVLSAILNTHPVDRTGPDAKTRSYLARVVRDSVMCTGSHERHTLGQLALKHDDAIGISKAGCKLVPKNTRVKIVWTSRDGFGIIESSAEPSWFMSTLDLEKDYD